MAIYSRPILRPNQQVVDTVGDPYLRSLFFGTEETPGFINQLQQIARKRFETPLPEQKFADLTDLEQAGLDRLRSGIGNFERFLTSGEDQLSAIRDLQDPFAYKKFEDPYQQAVIDQYTQDAVKAFDMSENQRRFNALGAGESAFGSRARLGAQDRLEEFSRGLGKELAGIRQAGYRDSISRLRDEITDRRNLFGDFRDLAGDTQRLTQTGIQNLLGLGSTQRKLDDIRSAAEFNRATAQRNDPLETMRILSTILPSYSPTTANITSQFGRAPDPRAVGLGSFLNTFSQFMPNINTFAQRPQDPTVYSTNQNQNQQPQMTPAVNIYNPQQTDSRGLIY